MTIYEAKFIKHQAKKKKKNKRTVLNILLTINKSRNYGSVQLWHLCENNSISRLSLDAYR